MYPIGGLDCVAEKAGRITYGPSGKISIIDELVIDPRMVAEAPQLFRADLSLHTYVIGQALEREIRAARRTNVLLAELRVGV